MVEKYTNSPCRTVFAGICAESIVRMPAVHGLYSIDKWEHEFYTNVLNTLIISRTFRLRMCIYIYVIICVYIFMIIYTYSDLIMLLLHLFMV